MKTFIKTLAALLVLALSASAVCSCGSSAASGGAAGGTAADSASSDGTAAAANVSADELLTAALAAYSADEIPAMKYYRSSQTDTEADDYLDHDYAGLLLEGTFGADIAAFDALDSYAMAVPEGKKAFEIDILKLKSASDADAVKALLADRLKQKDNGDLQTYAPEQKVIVDAAQITADGGFVYLFSTSDNDAGLKAVKDYIAGHAAAGETTNG